MIKIVVAVCLILVLNRIEVTESLDNGLALTPVMGWMAWERYRCITDCDKYPDECISEDLFRRTADLMVSEGYKDAGYEYVNIDDCWMEKDRASDGRLVADRKRFPNGIKALADYIHSLGLKFGIYSDYGTLTCAGYPGLIEHQELDAQTFADWGVDFLKLDGCYSEPSGHERGYETFGQILNKTGRPMVFSCSWPAYASAQPNFELLKKVCNMWRNYGDIDDSWEDVKSISNWFVKNQNYMQPHAGPGHWNDPDTLILGNFGLSYEQSKTQMAIWTILAAPLLMSNDLQNVTPDIKAILQNKKIIEVNQDKLGIQGWSFKSSDRIEIFKRPILPIYKGEYSYAIAFVNYREDGTPYSINTSLAELELKNRNGYRVTDLFGDTNEIKIEHHLPNRTYEIRINPTGVVFYKFTPLSKNKLKLKEIMPKTNGKVYGKITN